MCVMILPEMSTAAPPECVLLGAHRLSDVERPKTVEVYRQLVEGSLIPGFVPSGGRKAGAEAEVVALGQVTGRRSGTAAD